MACPRGAERQALFGEIVLMQADMHVGRHHHIHQLSDSAASDWLINSTYSSTERTCSRGLKRFSSPMVETVSPL